jgi:putative hydrolase of the HAD superfamily
VQALQQLNARGLHVGLISNADDDGLVQRAMIRLGLAPHLEPIVTSAALKWRKPNPEIFRYVANLWQVPSENLVMVGDAPRYDILGAHRAGMRGILIDRNEGHWWQQIPDNFVADPAIRPDATVSSLLEIPEILEHW